MDSPVGARGQRGVPGERTAEALVWRQVRLWVTMTSHNIVRCPDRSSFRPFYGKTAKTDFSSAGFEAHPRRVLQGTDLLRKNGWCKFITLSPFCASSR
jgi:hypothetical protein